MGPPLNHRSSPDSEVARQPTKPPPFGVRELRAAVPEHCFERSLAMSSLYLAVDLAVVAVLFGLARLLDTHVTEANVGASAPYVSAALWVAYWIAQGCVMTGVWVIAHECGHGAFSDYTAVNDAVGLVCHSALLVPYFSWAISHRRHHSNTGSLERDEVFVPKHEDEVSDSVLLHSAPGRAVQILATLTIGWPLYLAFNATGHKYEGASWWNLNHFSPTSPIYSPRERVKIVVSDVFLAAFVYVLYLASVEYTFLAVAKYYLVPYLIVNFWLVLITLLQHSDPTLPHYDGKAWDWVRGALATVDRDYGFFNIVSHHIGDTHVAHHLFSTMPHYHAEEATEALRRVLGGYYRKDSTPIAVALWRCFRECAFVREEGEPGVYWFHPAAEKGVKGSKSE